MVDYGAHVRVLRGIPHGNSFDPRFELLEKLVVDALIDDGAGTSRAFLTLKAKSGSCNTFYGRIEIGVCVHHNRVLAAHLEDRALDPDLAGSLIGSNLVDAQTHFARTSKCYVARLGMRHDGIAKTRARARAEVHDAPRHARFFQQFDELRRDRGRVARRLQNHRVPRDDRSQGHARHDRSRKVPRRNYRAHAQRDVEEIVALSG